MDPKLRQEIEGKMKKTIEALGREFGQVRTGRASLTLLDQIRVEYYGTPTPLNQVATLNIPEAKLITIQPWDTSLLGPIEKSISKSDLGVTPVNDGKIIRVPIPALSEERRKQLVKQIKQLAEETRVAIRHVRREANDALKEQESAKQISEDMLKSSQGEVQKLHDKYMQEIDKVLQTKEQEILKI
ncbi:MAG: ribosome recycling factor [Deltaproteobacteria bacterium]|nr:ribosome recycling factor [Deltaproteobacteria bacterium]